MNERILIIDGLNQFIRNWAIVPSMDINGEHIGGITGFLRSTKAAMRECKPTEVIVVWDGEGGSRQRRGIYKEYKEGRKPRVNREYDFEDLEKSQANLKFQYGRLKELLPLVGVKQVEIAGCEADDVIAYICLQMFPQTEKVVVSGDKDLLQLVNSKTLVYSPAKKKYYAIAEMLEDHGVLPENWVFVKALMGDGSDNIKGVRGVGEKTALKLFPFLAERAVTLEEVLQYAEANVEKNPRLKVVLDGRDVFTENVRLMQLSVPIIGGTAVRQIRHAVDQPTTFAISELKLSFIRDGVQLSDADFFPVFNEYRVRFQATHEATSDDTAD